MVRSRKQLRLLVTTLAIAAAGVIVGTAQGAVPTGQPGASSPGAATAPRAVAVVVPAKRFPIKPRR